MPATIARRRELRTGGSADADAMTSGSCSLTRPWSVARAEAGLLGR
jgi:hypothetical protein